MPGVRDGVGHEGSMRDPGGGGRKLVATARGYKPSPVRTVQS